ncbi:MAG: glycosyltransferase [Patescibacteria group bacterium]|jgi:glycosyltransferase involved in cell wall biosynthesis
MKIGLMHNLYGEYSRGGAETAVKLMADDFRKSGHQVFLIATRPKIAGNDEAKTTAEKIYYIDSEFYNLNKHSRCYRASWHIGDIFSFGKARQIKTILESEKPDLVVTHNLMGLGFMTPVVLKKLLVRHEHFLHDIQLLHPSGLMIFGQEEKINNFGAKVYQALTRLLFSSPDKIISPSDWLLEMHKQRGFFKDSKQEVRPFIWPGMETASQTKNGPAKNFLFIGQIEEQKGIFLLINAFKKINGPELTLTIAIRGGGSSLEKARTEAKADARIKILGPLSYEETEKIKKESDCLIVPSLCYENSPTTIYGAHAAGLPVIASRLGGIPELIEKDDLLFAPGNENDLIGKILLMAN